MEFFSTLYTHSFERVFRYFLVRTRHVESSEDLTHDTFLRYYNKYPLIDSVEEGCKILWGIARNVHLEWITKQILSFKKLQLQHTILLLREQSTDQEQEDYDLLRKKLRKALESLPQKQREIALLFYRDQMTKSQIAKQLGIPKDHVKTYLKRATTNLKKLLNTSSGVPL